MYRTNQLYQHLFRLYSEVHKQNKQNTNQQKVNELWKTFKTSDGFDEDKYKVVMSELQEKADKNKVGIKGYFRTATQKTYNPSSFDPRKEIPNEASETESTDRAEKDGRIVESENIEKETVEVVDDITCENDEDETHKKSREKPKQRKLETEIANIEVSIANLVQAKAINSDERSAATLTKRIKELEIVRDNWKKQLKIKIQNAAAQKKLRETRKVNLEKAREKYPDLAVDLKIRDNSGRPRIEVDQPNLLKDILAIATVGAACSDKRRDDLFRTVKTLDDLKSAVDSLGYKISRSALYYRLLPKNARTQEGKKHVNTVPVRLVRPENNLRKGHKDRMFAAETFKSAERLVEIFGPESATYISQDDKSSVHIGVTAAKRQSAMLMNMRARVRLPDHDFAVGSRHLLTPSVVAHCNVDPLTGKVGYTGATKVAIRSSKHNNSNAFTHHDDLIQFIEEKPDIFKNKKTGEVKPILVKGVDGGPDENPRFDKNITMACKTFQV